MYPKLLSLPNPFSEEPWALHTYGVLIATGFLFAMTLAKRQAEREGEDPERVVDLAFYVLLFGLIGSRIVFIFTKLDEYLRNPIQILFFWQGGLVWYGGFILAAFYVYRYCTKHGLKYWKFADLFIPYVALAHAFGRLGCLAAGCCFGSPTEVAWGVVFPYGSMAHQQHHRDGLIQSFADPALAVHATQLYEAGAEMLMFWLLVFLRPRKRFHGHLMLVWLSIYPILRTVIEFFRGDKERGVYLISTSQWISIAVAGFAVWTFFHLRKVRHQQLQTAS